MDWDNFKLAVKECRKNSMEINGFRTCQTIYLDYNLGKIEDVRFFCFDLNPWCVNLKTGLYEGQEINLMSGRRMSLPSLKWVVERM